MVKQCSFGKVRTFVWGKIFELLNIKFYVMDGELCESSKELVEFGKHFDLFWTATGYILVARKDDQINVIFSDDKNVENSRLEECIFSQIDQLDVWKKIFKVLNVRFYVSLNEKLCDVLSRLSERIGTKHFDLFEMDESYLALTRGGAKTYVIFTHKTL